MEQHVARGLLSREVSAAARGLLRSLRWEPQFIHGDMLLSNCMFDGRRVTLLDWEFAGYGLTRFDEALLWTLLEPYRAQRGQIADRMRAWNVTDVSVFCLNLLTVIAREIHILRESGIEVLVRQAARLTSELQRVERWLWSRDVDATLA